MIIGAVGLVLAVGNAVVGVYLGMTGRLGGSPNSTTMKDQLQAVETTGFAQSYPNLVVTDVTVEFDGAGRLLPQDRSSGVTMLTCYQAFIDYTTADGSCQGGEVHHGMLALIDGQWSYDMYAQIDFDTWAGHECGDFTMRPPQWCLTATPPTNLSATPGEPSTEFKMQDATAYFDRGLDHYKQGNLEAAIEDYTTAIELDPQYVLAYYDRGGARSEQGNLDAAIEDYTRAIELDPQFAVAYYSRGVARSHQGDLSGAIQDYTTAIELDPQFAYAYCNRGFARYEQGNLDAAIPDFDMAIELDPRDALAYLNRGNARYDKGDWDAAIQDFDKAIALDPQDALVYVNRGNARKAQGDLAGAIADFRRYLELAPDASGRQQVEEWIAELEKQLSNP